MEAKRIKIHLADDHQILIEGIAAVLKTEPNLEVVGFSLDGQSVLDWFKENDADILILDIGMPVMDGLDVLRSFKSQEKFPDTIVFTSYNDVKMIKEVLALGAKGFITKVSAGENIIHAVKTVYAGELYFSSDIRSKIVDTFTGKNPEEGEVQKPHYLEVLSERELEILKLISEECSNKDIAEKLFISPATVDTHKRKIMSKLGIKNTLGLAMYLVKNKLINE